MELIVPTNWDERLIPEFKALGIKEVYGKLAIDAIGGGRFASGLSNISMKKAGKYIRKLQDGGMKFNYLLNAPCFSSQEFTRSGRKKIKKLLNWLRVNGVTKITVAIPYLLQMIKDSYSDFEICVSTYAGIDSCQKAKYWQKIGADEITLLDTRVNRMFKLLKNIREGVTIKLRLIGNTSCLYDCHLFQYHALLAAHGSQIAYSHKAGFAVDYCAISCRYSRLADPSRFIHSQWIRPEDLSIYEEIGIDGIKLIDRRCSTDTIVKITKSYCQRKYEGNLLDLLPAFHGKSVKNLGNLLLKIRYYFHPFENNMVNSFRAKRLLKDIDVYIDNKKLDGFIKKFIEEDCSLKQCSQCQYCNRIAKETVVYDQEKMEETKRFHKEFLDGFIQGKC